MGEEETDEEVEAAIAVYGADCTVLCRWPPHLLVRLQPRTANDISQQFVEAMLGIKGSTQYPVKPPVLELNNVKGLEDGRVLCLLSELRALADDLTANPMIVAICETALDRITEMNQPDGNCCFCMESLVMDNEVAEFRPFMKLLSCFHCFHSECFVRWWRWILQKKNLDKSNLLFDSRLDDKDQIASCMKLLEQTEVKCPVCRKSIDVQDLVSIWRVLTADLGPEQDFVPDSAVILSEIEQERKAKFAEIIKVQQRLGGIIEPRKLDVIVPGMFVPVPSTSTDEESGQASSTIQVSESSSLSVDGAGETQALVLDSFSLGDHQTMGCEDADMAGKFMENNINPPARRNVRRSNRAGAKRGFWVRRDHAGLK